MHEGQAAIVALASSGIREATAQRGYTACRTSKRELRRATDAPAPISSRQRLRRSSRLTRETLANLSITGHLCRFSDQPVAEIVQCGEPPSP